MTAMILALALIWAALIVAVLVAIARYRDTLEGSVSEERIASIYERNGKLVLRRRGKP